MQLQTTVADQESQIQALQQQLASRDEQVGIKSCPLLSAYTNAVLRSSS